MRSSFAVLAAAGLLHPVAAALEEMDVNALRAAQDLGLEVIRFDDPAAWSAGFLRLAAALGRAA